jgi:hypothetical protein
VASHSDETALAWTQPAWRADAEQWSRGRLTEAIGVLAALDLPRR